MASEIDGPRARSRHARQSGVGTARLKAQTRADPLTAYSIATYTSSNSHSLKRKKSSDSTSTGTAVTAPEDEESGCNMGLHERIDRSAPLNSSPAAPVPSRTFIARRRSRPRMDNSHDPRPERDLARGEPSRRLPHAPAVLAQRRENDHVGVEYSSRRDKGKAVDRSSSSHPPSSSRRVSGQPLERSGDAANQDRRRECSSDKRAYSGPLAHAEFDRMRREIENWKQAAADHKKTARKHAKKIEELKAQVTAETLARKEQDIQLQILKADVEKRDELITSIDTTMQCQICMDTLNRPYALSPCGHVLCLNCLQEWFRKAPPAVDDSDMDPDEQDDPHYILTRPKSCPCCRAVVTRRPVPIFVVKAVATALAKYKIGPGAESGRRTPSPNQEDPWRGLFQPSSGEEEEDDGDVDISSEDEYGDVIGWGLQGGFQSADIQIAHRLALSRQSYMLRYNDDDDSGSDSATGSASASASEDGIMDDEEDGSDSVDSNDIDVGARDVYGVYVPAEWEPPSVNVDAEEYVFRNEGVASSTLRMLRRGCTLDMVRLFGMAYTHSRGLVAHLWSLDELWPFPANTVPRNHRVFLGWNVKLGEADYNGERYMRWVLTDMKENPARWTWVERTNTAGEPVRGAYDVTRLVRLQDVEDYDTTDTEVWLDAYH